MHPESSAENYLEKLKELLKREVEKIDHLKEHAIAENMYETSSQFRDIQKKILDFLLKL